MSDTPAAAPLSFTEFPALTAADWQARLARDLKGRDPATLRWPLPDGLVLAPFYDREAWTALGGPPPPLPAPAAPWRNLPGLTVPAAAPDGRAQIDHAAYALTQGADGVHFDLPHDGTAFDVAYLAQQLPLADTYIGYTVAARPDALLRRLTAALPGGTLRGFLRFAPGPVPEGAPFDEYRDALRNCVRLTQGMADFQALGINGSFYGNRGATPTQQIAFSLSVAVAMLNGLPADDLPLAEVARALHWHVAVGPSYFPELAKLRAMRRLWATLLHAYALPVVAANDFRIHAATSSWNRTTLDAHTNLLRHTTEAMSAVLGGADSISVAAYDCLFHAPNEFGDRQARNLPLLLREEASLGRVADPAAGSYFVETLTDELARAAWALFQHTEAAGGLLAVRPQLLADIKATAAATFARIAAGQQVVVGTNKFQNRHETFDFNPKKLLRSADFDTTRASYPAEVLRLATALHFERRAKQSKRAALVLLGTGTIQHIEDSFYQLLPPPERPEMRHSHPTGTLSVLFSSPEGATLMYATPAQFIKLVRTVLRVPVEDHHFMPPTLLTTDLATMQEALRVFGFEEFSVQGHSTEDVLARLQGR